MTVLVTGGAGYIGTHTCVLLLEAGFSVVVADNFSNSRVEAVNRVERITGKKIMLYECSLLNEAAVGRIFDENEIDAVVHFAGLKAVGESVEKPLSYYHNNITGTVVLCKAMAEHGVKRIVFSSSATVYGSAERMPLTEEMPLSAANPYGTTKLIIEMLLRDLYRADGGWSVSILRYFNPVGAHESGLIGEDPLGRPNNIMPCITRNAVSGLDPDGTPEVLMVFGADYPTKDGTGVRDYIHVLDLAEGHLNALNLVSDRKGVFVHNLGSGTGYSVLEILHAFEKVNGVKIRYEIAGRRKGDVAVCYADTTRARVELGWSAKRTLEDMCCDAWNWQRKNPKGYC